MTIADGLYVVLAERLRADLVTGDVKLACAPGLALNAIHP
jgi:predicted nucleic acid-binding protein